MKSHTWYYLDPDNNKDEPASPHCARCKKLLKATQAIESFIAIVLHPTNPWYRIAGAWEKSNGLIGSKCHEKMLKEYGEQE